MVRMGEALWLELLENLATKLVGGMDWDGLSRPNFWDKSGRPSRSILPMVTVYDYLNHTYIGEELAICVIQK